MQLQPRYRDLVPITVLDIAQHGRIRCDKCLEAGAAAMASFWIPGLPCTAIGAEHRTDVVAVHPLPAEPRAKRDPAARLSAQAERARAD